MEDESDEWMSEEYYPPSLKEPNTSNLEWILSTGYGLGKKVAITSVVISSAPIVLPPLVVISALGFACSVPFGLFYASYACTDKLMSKLLSSPDSPPLIHEFEMDSSDEEKEEFAGFEGEFVVEEQEKEEMEDLIELDENGELGVGFSKYEDEYWPNDVVDYENKSMEVKEESEKEEVYDEDGGEYLADEEKREENFLSEEGNNEVILVEVTQLVLLEESNIGMGDDAEIAFLENLDDSYNGDIETREVNKEVNEEQTDDKNVFLEYLDDVHTANFVEGNKEEDVKVEEMKGIQKEFGDENVKTDELCGEDNMTNGKKRNIIEVGGEENDETTKEKNAKLEKLNVEVNAGDSTSEQKKVNAKVKRRRGKKRGKASLYDKKLNDGNKIDEEMVGKDLLKPIEDKGSGVGDDRLRENMDNAAEKIAHFIELPVSKGVEAKETNSPIRSSEVLLSEEKLWQQLDALRAIVGYEGKRDSTLIGELKALYIFTGIEPPTSFKDLHDLVGLDEKLRILMSVVGVK